MNYSENEPETSYNLREPVPEDGQHLYNLVSRSEPLDLNSLYAYILVCDHFRNTSVVAEDEEGAAGFISGYSIPGKDNTLFIWQVAVDPRMRRKGLAGIMIQNILERNNQFRYIETTVTPSNDASDKLFRSVADKLNTELTVLEYYPASFFGGSDHEPENLYRIGPFTV